MNTLFPLSEPKKETEIQAEIVRELRFYGWTVFRMNAGRIGGVHLHPKGTLDLLAMKNSVSIWIEVKNPGGKLSEEQKKEIKRQEANGFRCYVLHSVHELRALRRKKK